MPVENVAAQFAPKIVNPLDVQNALAQTAANQLSMQHTRMQLQQMQADQADTNALRAAYRGGADPSTPEGRAALIQAAPLQAPKIFQQQADLAKAQAETEKFRGQGAEAQAKAAQGKIEMNAQKLFSVNTPDAAHAWIDSAAQRGDISPQDAATEHANVPTDPSQLSQWKNSKMMEAVKVHDRLTLQQQAAKDAETARHNQTGEGISVSNNAANNAAHLKGIGIQQAGENSRAAASRAIETVKADPFGTLGLNKNVPANVATAAGLSGDEYLKTLPPGVAGQVKAMAEGKVQISPMTIRTPQGQAMLQMAMQYEPGTDQTTYASRYSTAKDAASGTLAKSNNALNTVAGHLSALADSADKLNNTSFPWVNKVKNAVSSNLGDPAVKTFNMNLNGVADELERAYRGAGGSEGSIKLWRENLGDANSPDQFRSVMAKGAEMLQSKLQANQAQYEQGMHGKLGDYRTVTPETQAAFDRLTGKSNSDIHTRAQAILKGK